MNFYIEYDADSAEDTMKVREQHKATCTKLLLFCSIEQGKAEGRGTANPHGLDRMWWHGALTPGAST
jgi:hypothetical protein